MCICMCIYIHIIYIYIYIHTHTLDSVYICLARWLRRAALLLPIFLLRLSLLRLLDANFPGNSLRALEFHPLKSRLCLSRTL